MLKGFGLVCTVADVCAILVRVLSRPTGGAGRVGHGLIFCPLLMSEITKADVCKHISPPTQNKLHCRVIRAQPLQHRSFISLAEPGDNVELNKDSDRYSQRVQIQILSFRTHSAAGDHGIGLLISGLILNVCFFLLANVLTLCRNHLCFLHFKWLELRPGLVVTATWCTCGQC